MPTKTYRLIGADGRPYDSATKGKLGGHMRSKIYGRPDCPGALRAIARGNTYQNNRVFFADEATAVAAGYRPCAVCLRDAYKRWREGQR
jgi:methylphosphotriester-DNA--protein-cysteine methyltransferase